MFLARVSINRPIMTTMGILVFIIFGYLGFQSLPLNTTPEVEIPFVTIQTIYPGAGPKEIETQVSKKLEDQVATVSGIKRLESYSLDGVSIVMIEFKMTKDVNVAFQEVKSKVDQVVNFLPDDAEDPIVEKVDLQSFPIIDIVLSGDMTSVELFELADKEIKDRFAQIQGVAQVQVSGGQKRELHVNLDNRMVFENMISLPALMQILKMQNMDIPGGYLKVENQEYTIRLSGKYKNPQDISELKIPTAGGNKKLRQVAEVSDAGSKIRERAIFYDSDTKILDPNVVRLSIIKSSDGNAVNVSEEMYKILPEIEDILPSGVNIKIINDNSVYTRSTVDDTLGNIFLGILFTSLVLIIFLHDWRSILIIVLSMPTSIISTFLLMQMADFTINMMSLMGLSVSVGVLVSNSVVVLENIFRYKSLGETKKQAAYKGTSEIAVAVIAATLTNVVVFIPLANMSSMVGEFLRELAATAAFSTIFSLIMSFTLTPMLASKILPDKAKEGVMSRALNKWEKMWEMLYHRTLSFVLKSKWISLGIVVLAVLAFVFSAGTFGSKLGSEFIPQGDDGKVKIQVELPVGYNLDKTSETIEAIIKKINVNEEVDHIIAKIGKSTEMDIGTNLALLEVYLVDVKERERSIFDMIDHFVTELAVIPNAMIKVSPLKGMAGPGDPVEFYLLGQDLKVLEEYKDIIVDKVQGIKGLLNFDNSSRAGKPEITIVPKRDKLAQMGVSVMDIALTLRASIEGMVSTQYSEFGNEYDVLVTLDNKSVYSPEQIGSISVISNQGQNSDSYRLSQLCDIDYTIGFTKVLHRNKYTTIKFTGSNAEDTPMGNVIADIEQKLDEIDFPNGYRIQWGGLVEMQQEMIADMMFALMIAFVLTYMLLAAILESFFQPLNILFTVFLGMIGVFVLMYYTGTSFGITSMMGIIMLIGIVVNNSILILDYTNQLRREKGLSPKDSLLEAGPTKLKPIIMASLAIMLGMLPMALGIGDAGAEMRIPLGIVSIGGLISSTVLTLWVTPAVYFLTTKDKETNIVEKV